MEKKSLKEDLDTAVADARQALDARVASPALRMLITMAVVASACWAGAGLLCVVVGFLAVVLSIAVISLFSLGVFLFVVACVAGAWAFTLSWAAAWAYIAGSVFQGFTRIISRSYQSIVSPRGSSHTSAVGSKRGLAVAAANQRPNAASHDNNATSNAVSGNRAAPTTLGGNSDDIATPDRTPGAQGGPPPRRSEFPPLPSSTEGTNTFSLKATAGQDKDRQTPVTAAQKLQPFAGGQQDGENFKQVVLKDTPTWEGVAGKEHAGTGNLTTLDAPQADSAQNYGAPTAPGGPALFSSALRSAMVQ